LLASNARLGPADERLERFVEIARAKPGRYTGWAVGEDTACRDQERAPFRRSPPERAQPRPGKWRGHCFPATNSAEFVQSAEKIRTTFLILNDRCQTQRLRFLQKIFLGGGIGFGRSGRK